MLNYFNEEKVIETCLLTWSESSESIFTYRTVLKFASENLERVFAIPNSYRFFEILLLKKKLKKNIKAKKNKVKEDNYISYDMQLSSYRTIILKSKIFSDANT